MSDDDDKYEKRAQVLMQRFTTREIAYALARSEDGMHQYIRRPRRYDLSTDHQREAFAERLHERIGQLKFSPRSASDWHSLIDDVFDATHTTPLPDLLPTHSSKSAVDMSGVELLNAFIDGPRSPDVDREIDRRFAGGRRR